jgi:hypothetical protein
MRFAPIVIGVGYPLSNELRLIVLVPPTTTAVPAGPRDIGVPSTVVAGAPGKRVLPSRTYWPAESGLRMRFAPIVTGEVESAAGDGRRSCVSPSIIMAVAEGQRDRCS